MWQRRAHHEDTSNPSRDADTNKSPPAALWDTDRPLAASIFTVTPWLMHLMTGWFQMLLCVGDHFTAPLSCSASAAPPYRSTLSSSASREIRFVIFSQLEVWTRPLWSPDGPSLQPHHYLFKDSFCLLVFGILTCCFRQVEGKHKLKYGVWGTFCFHLCHF